jgi:hypothetical protein
MFYLLHAHLDYEYPTLILTCVTINRIQQVSHRKSWERISGVLTIKHRTTCHRDVISQRTRAQSPREDIVLAYKTYSHWTSTAIESVSYLFSTSLSDT